MRTVFLCISVLKVASGPSVKLASCIRWFSVFFVSKGNLFDVYYSTDRSQAVVPVLVLLFVALYVLPCVILFLCCCCFFFFQSF